MTGTALVLGATGGIGGEIATALLQRDWTVSGLARDPEAAAKQARPALDGIHWVKGDALDRDSVVSAATGADIIVHAVNPPGYRRWDELVMPMLENSIAAAQAAGGARIVLPGTLYNYDPAATPLVDETTAQRGRSRKGRVRIAMEERLRQASAQTPVLILRAGDFFGAEAKSSWFSQALVKPGKPVTKLVNPGRGVGHGWAYLPDLARAFSGLIERRDHLARFEVAQFEGHWDADGTAIPNAIRRVVGNKVPERAFPWWLMRLLAPFGGMPREVVEIAPFWRHPMRMDNRRLVALLGAEPRTPLDEAIGTTLAGLGCLDARKAGTGGTNPLSRE